MNADGLRCTHPPTPPLIRGAGETATQVRAEVKMWRDSSHKVNCEMTALLYRLKTVVTCMIKASVVQNMINKSLFYVLFLSYNVCVLFICNITSRLLVTVN